MNKKSIRGFTLIEALLYVALLGLLLGSIGAFVVWVLRVNVKVNAMHEVVANAERVKDSITQEARSAVSLYTPTTTSSQLSLETKENLPPGETSTFVDFFLCSEQLCKKTEGQGPIAVTSSSVQVRQFQITQVSSSRQSAQVHLVLAYPNPDNRPEAAASQDITFSVAVR